MKILSSKSPELVAVVLPTLILILMVLPTARITVPPTPPRLPPVSVDALLLTMTQTAMVSLIALTCAKMIPSRLPVLVLAAVETLTLTVIMTGSWTAKMPVLPIKTSGCHKVCAAVEALIRTLTLMVWPTVRKNVMKIL
jgi:hypothetical protein